MIMINMCASGVGKTYVINMTTGGGGKFFAKIMLHIIYV
jgi:hypothetical protein